MSRSVKIPTRCSSSITSAEPVRCRPITVAAWATVSFGLTVTRSVVMTSRTVGMCTSRFVLPRTEAYPAPGTLCAVDTRAALLAWYEPRRRRYPWRVGSNPYRVLVSEVMLQQTQAERVAPAFERFLERLPDVRSLAGASRAGVLRAWGSLGYNRRAVRLSEAARAVVRDHGGRIPADPDALRTLPGVGPYTAAAVASIGHGVPVAAVDVNVRRVVARARLGRDPGEVTASAVRAEGQAWLDGRE